MHRDNIRNASIEKKSISTSRTLRLDAVQASTFGWHRYVSSSGTVIGVDTFVVSAPLETFQSHFSFTPDAVVTEAKQPLNHADHAAA